MDDKYVREEFDTGKNKIRHEIKSRLVHHGLYGSVIDVDTGGAEGAEGGPTGSRIEIIVKGRSAARSFDREQIEHCCLRVGGEVLLGIIAMVDEVSTESR
jgi:hypothetical protein